MPRLARYHIKAGLLYLALALIVGVVLVAQPLLAWSSSLALLRPVFLHLLIVGWITQLIIGVAYWMFPKHTKAQPRGSAINGWLVFVLLNLGLMLRVISEPLAVLYPGTVIGLGLAASAVAQVLAGWLFVVTLWPRVKER